MNVLPADSETKVAPLYQEDAVASKYVEERFTQPWQRLLHTLQVAAVRDVIVRSRPCRVLEIAPGPARIAVDLDCPVEGVMVEYSRPMISLARRRLAAAGRLSCWSLVQANAFHLETIAAQFDLIYTFRFIRHFHAQDRERLYSQIVRCLNPGGAFLLDVVNRDLRSRLDRLAPQPPPGSLSVYDATYTVDEFTSEVNRYGFAVQRMIPVLHRFPVQSWISSKLHDVVPRIARAAVGLFEHLPATDPLEWIALCTKL